MRKKVRRRFKFKDYFKIFVFFIPFFITALLIFVDVSLRPVVQKVAQTRTQSIVTQTINNTITTQIENLEISYEDLVILQKDNDGEIISLSYDSLQMNRLKALMTSAVLSDTDKIPSSYIHIPIGNITSFDLFQNKGPTLKFKITPITYVEVDIETEFENTGINQVNHRIFLTFDVSSDALISNYSTNINIKTKVCVAETIIVGKVPNNIGSNSLMLSEGSFE